MSAKDKETKIVDNKNANEKNQVGDVKEKVEDAVKEESEEVKEEVSEEKKETEEKEKKIEEVPEKSNDVESKQEADSEINNKANKTKGLMRFIIIAVILIICLIFSTIFALMNMNKTTITKGVTIKGIDVSNLTIEEATNKVNEAINKELMLGMILVYGDAYRVDFDTSQIEYSYDVFNSVKEAYNVGRSGNIIENNYTLLLASCNGKNIDIEGSYNEEFLDAIVDDIGSKIPGLVTQASHYIEGNQLIITKGQPGVVVKKDELKKDIIENIKNRNSAEITNNSSEQFVQIQVENVEPDPIDVTQIYNAVYCEPQDAYYIPEPFQIFPEKEGINFAISIEEAQAIVNTEGTDEYTIPLILTPASKTIDDIGTEAFPYLISSYTTKYDASNTNRSGNLKLAADKINGRVLMPGEEFSFNEVVGKRTIEAGYKNAKIYENGQVVDGLAGGICQISSTLYNAVVLANLEVTERRNHSFTSTYVPAGRDATVVYGRTDFKFKNSRAYPIKIEASVASGIAEFKIHGIKEEVEYEIKIIPVTTQSIPYQTIYVPDPALAPGQQVVTQAGHSGCRVTTYVEKRLGGVVVSKDVLSNDTYNAMNTIVNVGP